jgi:two-component system, OmpR family, sensor kinase
MRSIERYLLAWIMGALCLGAVVIVLVTYLITLDEMNEIFDADLKNVAEALGTHHRSGAGPGDADLPRLPARTDVADPAEVVTITWTPDGRRVFSSDPRVAIPFMSREALAQVRVAEDDWIVYTDVSVNGVAQAAQRVSARHATAAESASKTFVPMLGLVVFVAGLMVLALRRGLRPLDMTARNVATRSASSLTPIATLDIPREIAPLVSSINELMGRLSQALATQRRFLADAAHELRTPVTALRLQLQLLKRADDEPSRTEAVAELEAGIDRSQRLIEQLLHVARFEPDGEQLRREPVDLGDLVRAVVGALSVKADHRGVDLGAAGDAGVLVHGDAGQLTALLNNLVENALRYTPQGGVVDVDATRLQGRPMLRVIDSGPGIAASERERVFARFYRSDDAPKRASDPGGSGLGLAIVRAVAERHAAAVTLHTPASGQGLEVRVMFPPGSA